MIDQEYYYEFRPDPDERMLMEGRNDGREHVFKKHKMRAGHEIAALILDKRPSGSRSTASGRCPPWAGPSPVVRGKSPPAT